jgi:hypothetical protein
MEKELENQIKEYELAFKEHDDLISQFFEVTINGEVVQKVTKFFSNRDDIEELRRARERFNKANELLLQEFKSTRFPAPQSLYMQKYPFEYTAVPSATSTLIHDPSTNPSIN